MTFQRPLGHMTQLMMSLQRLMVPQFKHLRPPQLSTFPFSSFMSKQEQTRLILNEIYSKKIKYDNQKKNTNKEEAEDQDQVRLKQQFNHDDVKTTTVCL